MAEHERTPDVVTFTFETTVDYVVNLATGEVKVEHGGEPAEEPHYVALFCEGEFAGEYHDGATPEGDDVEVVERAKALLDASFEGAEAVGADA